MSALIPIALYYDPGRSNWYFHAKEQVVVKQRIFYWGARQKPVILLAYNGLQTPPGALPMKALITSDSRPLLGPIIGILSAQNADGSLKGNLSNYKALMEAGRKIGGIVFAFGPSHVDWIQKIIYGKLFDEKNKKWVTCPFPFPNVVYNRIQDREHENKAKIQLCIKRFLSHRGLTLYNRGFFNKAEVIGALRNAPKIKKHIPETTVLLSKEDLSDMVKRHNAVYLKPAENRLGSGIIRVIKSSIKKTYTMHYYADTDSKKQLKKYETKNIHSLWNRIRKKQMIHSSYIIQQAIPVAVAASCPFDCRVLVQKNRRGRWQVSGLGIRVAAHSDSITTHVPRGGRIDKPENVLPQAFSHQKPQQIIKSVDHLCIAVAKKLEQHYHHLGEMSIDIGLDRKGHPWVFEANAKPMKFDEPEIREKQLGQVIRYAQFLTFAGSRNRINEKSLVSM